MTLKVLLNYKSLYQLSKELSVVVMLKNLIKQAIKHTKNREELTMNLNTDKGPHIKKQHNLKQEQEIIPFLDLIVK